MEPVGLTVSLAQTLLQTVTRAITWWNQTENAEVAEELSLFAKNLKHNIGVLSWRKIAKNTTSTYAIGTKSAQNLNSGFQARFNFQIRNGVFVKGGRSRRGDRGVSEVECCEILCYLVQLRTIFGGLKFVFVEALQEDLRHAQKDAERILMENVVESLWNAQKTMSELLLIHHRVITSFQIQLLFIIVDVTLDSREMQKFHAAMEGVQADILKAYAATNSSTRKELKAHMRKDIREMFTLLLAEMRSHGQSIEEVIFVIKGDERQAQTDDLERIFADLVAAAHEKDSLDSRRSKTIEKVCASGPPKSNTLKWYHDPITWEIMCDPVKASDRRTYDRWTLIHHARDMKLSPFDRSPHLQIIFDDIDVRSRLFQKFPEQEKMFRTLRSKYRQEALEKANSDWCDLQEVLVMLDHVLAWAENDDECRDKRNELLMSISMARPNGNDLSASGPSSSSSPGSLSDNPMPASPPNSSIVTPEFPQLMSWLERAYAEKTKGDIAFSEGDYIEAVVYFTSAISMAPQSESLYSKRSASNAFLRRYQDALEDAKIALDLKPGWAEGYLRLATAYQGMKRHREAIAAYKKGLEADPNNEETKAGLAASQGAYWKDRGYKFFICSQSHLLYLVISFVTLRILQKITP